MQTTKRVNLLVFSIMFIFFICSFIYYYH